MSDRKAACGAKLPPVGTIVPCGIGEGPTTQTMLDYTHPGMGYLAEETENHPPTAEEDRAVMGCQARARQKS